MTPFSRSQNHQDFTDQKSHRHNAGPPTTSAWPSGVPHPTFAETFAAHGKAARNSRQAEPGDVNSWKETPEVWRNCDKFAKFGELYEKPVDFGEMYQKFIHPYLWIDDVVRCEVWFWHSRYYSYFAGFNFKVDPTFPIGIWKTSCTNM